MQGDEARDVLAALGREIAAATFANEDAVVRDLVERARLRAGERRRVEDLASRLVQSARDGRRQYGGVDKFLAEYGLSTDEGIILMCLAEALLRVPDAATADDLIDDKIAGGNWERHLGQSDSLFVNASTWGLMLTGRVIGLKDSDGGSAAKAVKRMIGQTGEPVIRQAMRHAMRILGDQFVLGRTIKEALKRGRDSEKRGFRYSYDMLGEAARTAEDAERYQQRYVAAIAEVGRHAGRLTDDRFETLIARPGLSVKLSAIHPRFEVSKADRVSRELTPRLVELGRLAREQGLTLNIDAEEADRLVLTLGVYAEALAHKDLAGWSGLGMVVQAYGKRALPTLRWLRELARERGTRLPVRLVKGAYWDSEIKIAQEQGLADYPVFTRKANTDVSYLAAARYLLAEREAFYPQFATHNAHTIAAVETIADGAPFEFQRLHGMGEGLYKEVVDKDGLGRPCRVYAPVGGHEDLLAYLVRRLLENGANSSFVNRLADDELPIAEIIADPVEQVEGFEPKRNPRIPKPSEIFEPVRRNSQGLALWERSVREPLLTDMRAELAKPRAVGSIVGGEAVLAGEVGEVRAPHDRRLMLATVASASPESIDKALTLARAAAVQWDRRGGAERAAILDRVADLFERDRARLMAIIVREAGKTIGNALADLREAIDFLRYYVHLARTTFEDAVRLPGPTGEANTLSLHGRGVFACISPWNFPIAIFTGQIAGALAAGNAVVAKPAEQTPVIAFEAVKLMLEAGVPSGVIQLLTGDGTVGAGLVQDRRVDGVAFTGSNATAERINRALAGRGGPIVPLIAETGGINAMIVDSSALPEQVVRDAVASAFDSAGQRCSALRVLMLQTDVADKMLTMLEGASRELRIGDPLDYSTDIGPVIDKAAQEMLDAHRLAMRRKARTIFEAKLPAECEHGTFVAPSIYEIGGIGELDREVFGPVLHVVRYERSHLDKVCEAINATGYGLTLGVHSRIEATIAFIAERVRVGNLYCNRNQIGAVVGAQPFGGEGLSGTGPKAGGPHYLHRFATERVISSDLTARGGNTELLSLASGEPRGR
ncbi:MAG: bifunctional proline dehydrogenase/L-glutamate gamma-semialdehyde dehydrogenase PutA [Rhizobiales bacterium]|nr:bifunctional proline dehydrogenase/L-glutamate gamma-semialdehyde dehydrogenase PutA [Hyphomicrobiales bacterium]